MSTRYGVHIPPCVDLYAHIDAAVREYSGIDITLDDFVDEIRTDWADEQRSQDDEDVAVIAYWKRAEVEAMARFAR